MELIIGTYISVKVRKTHFQRSDIQLEFDRDYYISRVELSCDGILDFIIRKCCLLRRLSIIFE